MGRISRFLIKKREGENIMKTNTYFKRKDVSERLLKQNGFRKKEGCYTTKVTLYETYIRLILTIDSDTRFIETEVVDDKGELYAPFYNSEDNCNNLVLKEVIANYNKVMDWFVSQGILMKINNVSNAEKAIDLDISNTAKAETKENDTKTIYIKYFTDEILKLEFIEGEKSDWVDLRAAEEVRLKKGDFALIPLGVAMKLPKGYEAHIVPRSSTFKNFGLIQTNHMGVIDESYCGDNDIWCFPALAVRDTEIHVNDRICQFRIIKKMPKVTFKEVKKLNNKDRGGFGSTGKI